jgi:hypothetical protein
LSRHQPHNTRPTLGRIQNTHQHHSILHCRRRRRNKTWHTATIHRRCNLSVMVRDMSATWSRILLTSALQSSQFRCKIFFL